MAERQDVLYPPPPTSRTPRRSSRLSPPKRPSTTAMRLTRSQARQHPLPQSSNRITPMQSSSLSPPPPEVHERATANVEVDNSRPAALPFVPHIAHRYETPDHDLPPIVGMELEPLAEPRTPSRKRKVSTPPDSDSEDLADKGPLLSEYMCPICLSPPKQAIITPCGHILCGSCLHGSAAARPVAQNLCPVCRTVIPNLRFTLPDARPNPDTPLNVINRTPEDGVVDVDPSEREERWDPGRSGVIGLEILTIRNL